MKRSVLLFSVVVVVAVLALGSFLNLYGATMNESKLNSDLVELQEAYDELQTKYYDLLGNNSMLEWDYERVLMQNPYSNIPNPASSGDPDAGQYLSRYQALQKLYAELKTEYYQYMEDYAKLKGLIDTRLLHSNFRSNITPDDPDVVNVTYSITGKIGNITDPNSYWKDIKALYDWVNNNIEYREDGLYPVLPNNPSEALTEGLEQTDQMVQLPNETLSLRMGDCEDTAALLCSMVRAYFDKNFLVECIWITGENAGHVAIVIPFSGERIVILDPVRDYYSHDTLGNIALNSISTEIYNWMNIWRPSLGNDVHVYLVFSDYMDQYFDTTEEYIDWMYNR